MLRSVLGCILVMLVVVPVLADTTPQPWNWSSYSGSTQWQVTVTEDDSGCNGGATTTQSPVTIQFNQGTAVMGDIGHGSAGGTFISGNILHIPGRTVADPPGSSALSEYDIFFTTDCSAFTGKYSWSYTGPDTAGACTGTTSFSGTNNQGCPVATAVTLIPSVAPASTGYISSAIGSAHYDLINDLTLREQMTNQENDITRYEIATAGTGTGDTPEIAQERLMVTKEKAQVDATEAKIEGEYKAILDKDPTNFQANWDLAQLKKGQGNYEEYFNDVSTALSNKDIAKATQDEIRKNIATSLGLSEYPPTTANSYFIQRLTVDAGAVQSVYGINAGQGSTDPAVEPLRLFSIYGHLEDIVKSIPVGGPGTAGG
ncbi:MAG: hypothetical protein WCC86_09270 [Methanoregula sp.]